jgi:uncharacterized protein YdeI (YjbR/CyaY-like superfamily)
VGNERNRERGSPTLIPTFFKSAEDFRAWLQEHHASACELVVGFYRKKLGRGINYAEALDEALAFGWIDGVRKGVDTESYTIRFTPRKPGSIWSMVNIRRAEQLRSLGLMQPAGLRAFANRDEEKTRQYSYEREQQTLDPSLDKTLRANRKASESFDALPPGHKKLLVSWIMSAKKEETRIRRLSRMIEVLARGKRIDFLSPNKKEI